MKDFIMRLSSRKFLLTVAGIVATVLYPEQANKIVALVSAFIAAEGAADVVQRFAGEKTKQGIADLRANAYVGGVVLPPGFEQGQSSPTTDPNQPQTFVPGA